MRKNIKITLIIGMALLLVSFAYRIPLALTAHERLEYCSEECERSHK